MSIDHKLAFLWINAPVKKEHSISLRLAVLLSCMLLASTVSLANLGGGGDGWSSWLQSKPGNNRTGSNITTVGIQYKPVIPSTLFETGPVSFIDDNWNIKLTPTLGHSYGMVIRKGFTDRFSLEVGINQILRNYDIQASFNDTVYEGKGNFKFVGYEIPLQGLIYVRLGERMYMNNAFGLSLDMFASDIQTSDEYFRNYTATSAWLQLGMIANVGFEYRTEKSGFFYLGGSLHRPFSQIARTFMTFEAQGRYFEQEIPLIGNYLTIDLRYFFHEDAEKKTNRSKKKKKKKKSGGDTGKS